MYYAKQLIFKTLCFKKKKLLLTELKIKCLYVLPLKNVFYGLSISSVNPAQLLIIQFWSFSAHQRQLTLF